MLGTIEALRIARETGAAGQVTLVINDQRLPSKACMALKADDRIGQIMRGSAVSGFLVPEEIWDEMLLTLEG
jgi:hypothetical protein